MVKYQGIGNLGILQTGTKPLHTTVMEAGDLTNQNPESANFNINNNNNGPDLVQAFQKKWQKEVCEQTL